ncbi:MAG: DUF948 domain-containing protein [Bacteroidetes bacterium]|nr:DUF948 domain-containing protein [Bacteroidota bacterium]
MADTFIIISVILQILTIGVLIGFVAVLIKLIKALADKIENLSDDVLDLKKKSEPLIENTAKFLNTANRIADSVDKNMDTITNTLDTVKDTLTATADTVKVTVTHITDLVEDVREKVAPPVLETVASYNGIVKGIKVFFDAIKHRTGSKSSSKETHDDEYNIDYDESYLKKQRKTYNQSTSEYSELDNINAELNELRRKIQMED